MLQASPPRVWKQHGPAAQWGWQQDWPGCDLPGRGTAPLCWSEASRAGSVMGTRATHSQWAQTRPLGWDRVEVQPASPVRLRNSKAGLGHSCSIAQERPKTEELSLNAALDQREEDPMSFYTALSYNSGLFIATWLKFTQLHWRRVSEPVGAQRDLTPITFQFCLWTLVPSLSKNCS